MFQSLWMWTENKYIYIHVYNTDVFQLSTIFVFGSLFNNYMTLNNLPLFDIWNKLFFSNFLNTFALISTNWTAEQKEEETQSKTNRSNVTLQHVCVMYVSCLCHVCHVCVMSVSCLCHVCVMYVSCLCHVCVMSVSCMCHVCVMSVSCMY